MKRFTWITLLLLLAGFTGVPALWGLSLGDAIVQSADKIKTDLPPKSRVVITAFESPNENFSEYIMAELTVALFERGIEVADRRNLDYVKKELKFQASGEVDDKSAQSIGKFLGAQFVITGQLTTQGKNYRYQTSAIHVEKATVASITRFDVENNKDMQKLIAAYSKEKTAVKTTKYSVDEKTVPQTAGAFLDRGMLFAGRDDPQLAIEDFTEALKLDPNLAAAYCNRGSAYHSMFFKTKNGGDLDKAIADFTQAIKLAPNYADAYIGRGYGYYSKGDYDKAIADCTQPIKLEPNNAERYIQRGEMYSLMRYTDNWRGSYDKAIADYTQAIKLDPNNADWYDIRGGEYSINEEYNKAIADWTQAIKLDPNNARRYSSRGMVYKFDKDYDKAIADYTQAIKLEPNNAERYSDRGDVYYDMKDYNKAIADFTQAIKLDPNDSKVYNKRGNAYYDKKDYNKAIADYTQVIKLDPNLTEFYWGNNAYYRRGIAYYDKGDYDKAITDYETALRFLPDNANVKKRLEEARQKRGR